MGIGLPDPPGGDEVGAARRADEETVLFCQATHLFHYLFGVYGQGGVDQALVALEDAWDEAVGDALYEVVSDLSAQDRRRLGGLHREELDGGVHLTESLAHPDKGPPRPNAHHYGVGDDAIGELGQDLWPKPDPVLLDVPLRLELGRAEIAWFLPELLRLRQRLVDVEVADLHHLCPEGAADGDPLPAHPFGHHDEHPVTLDRGDHREGVARVARSCLDDRIAPSQ